MQTVNIRFRALFYNFTGHDMLFKETLCLYSYDIIYAIIFGFRYRCFYIFTAVSQIPDLAIFCIFLFNKNFQFFSQHGPFVILCMT